MKSTIFFLIGCLLILLITNSCKTKNNLRNQEIDTQEKPVEVEYFKLTNFPSAQHWTRPQKNEIPLISAHRGKPEIDKYVENSLEAIERLLQSGSFILELDVAKSKDGVLFLFHDYELDRLTRNTGSTGDRMWSELDTMRLIDEKGRLSNSTIPTLKEALTLAKGKAMFTLDRKQDVPLEEISDLVSELNMQSEVSLILYDFEDFTEWANLKTLGPISHEAPDVLVLEQLAQQCRELYKRIGVSPFKENEFYPNTGFLGVGLPDQKVLARAKTLGIKSIVGTFGDLDQRALVTDGQTYRDLANEGVSIIATNKPLLAHKALYGESAF